LEVFEHIRDIQDPEHPHTLEQLDVLRAEDIYVDDKNGRVVVTFTPTVAHCSMGKDVHHIHNNNNNNNNNNNIY
jgi:metal-sulfur cluster biosynthetic enzyme